MEAKSFSVKDLDLQLRLRSGKMSVETLEKITNLVFETLSKEFELSLAERNLAVRANQDGKLITLTSDFQSKD